MADPGHMAETLAELGDLIESLKAVRAEAYELQLRAPKVECY
jgi:hypothetical protein